jgi:hypothetical protein
VSCAAVGVLAICAIALGVCRRPFQSRVCIALCLRHQQKHWQAPLILQRLSGCGTSGSRMHLFARCSQRVILRMALGGSVGCVPLVCVSLHAQLLGLKQHAEMPTCCHHTASCCSLGLRDRHSVVGGVYCSIAARGRCTGTCCITLSYGSTRYYRLAALLCMQCSALRAICKCMRVLQRRQI